jgi:hypothetical protein
VLTNNIRQPNLNPVSNCLSNDLKNHITEGNGSKIRGILRVLYFWN